MERPIKPTTIKDGISNFLFGYIPDKTKTILLTNKSAKAVLAVYNKDSINALSENPIIDPAIWPNQDIQQLVDIFRKSIDGQLDVNTWVSLCFMNLIGKKGKQNLLETLNIPQECNPYYLLYNYSTELYKYIDKSIPKMLIFASFLLLDNITTREDLIKTGYAPSVKGTVFIVATNAENKMINSLVREALGYSPNVFIYSINNNRMIRFILTKEDSLDMLELFNIAKSLGI